jgi:hypothetical protein
MSEGNWNPWKLTAIGLALVMVTAVVTGIVVANWTGSAADRRVADTKPASEPASTPPVKAMAPTAQPPASPRVAATAPAPVAPPVSAAAPTPSVPTQAVVDACNRHAATTKDKTVEVVKDSAIAGLAGAAIGAAGGAIAGGGKGAGKGAGIGGVVGLGAGALYGLNENHKNDERYREAYAACMRARGYSG